MLGSCPQIAAECLPGAIAEWGCTLPPALAHDQRNVLLKVQMLQLDPDQLGNAQP
jgi:hypothetical protein